MKGTLSDRLFKKVSSIGVVTLTSEQLTAIANQIPPTDISGKVDKVTNKSLVLDTEIAKIHASGSDNQNLSNLVEKVTGKGLSTNDLTDLLKTGYDGAVTHAGSTHAPSNAQKNSDITKAEIEAQLTGTISTHSHASSGGLTQSQIRRLC
jgi:hypothetical protein